MSKFKKGDLVRMVNYDGPNKSMETLVAPNDTGIVVSVERNLTEGDVLLVQWDNPVPCHLNRINKGAIYVHEKGVEYA